jgi:endonuclease YncB( thermonuclease family)
MSRLTIAIVAMLLAPAAWPQAAAGAVPAPWGEEVRVVRVLDGRTVDARIRGGGRKVTIRLLGVAVPRPPAGERAGECGGAESAAFLRRLVYKRTSDDQLIGRVLVVVRDDARSSVDRARRYAGYLQTPRGVDVGAAMIASGWARGRAARPLYQRYYVYNGAMGDAEGHQRGVWGLCEGRFHRPAVAD